MIEFRNVGFAYEKDIQVLKGINLTIQNGERVGLIGANGAGKSTLMRSLLGLLTYTGDILVDSVRVEKQNLSVIRKSLGFVLQNSDNQMFMPTVLEDMLFGLLNYGMTRAEAEERVDKTLERLDILPLKHRYNHKISGGEKRMAAIATVLAMAPETIILDEPTVSLDPYHRRAVINTVNTLTQTKLIASHDLDMILDTCDRVVLIGDGKVVADGNAEDVLRDEKLLLANRMELPLRYMR